MRVFISYRRSDVGGYTGRLRDDLVPHLGADNVFQDVTGLMAGLDFAEVIERSLEDSDAVLAVIGPGWLTAVDGSGRTRLDDPDDFVRIELRRALVRGIPVVPVLVGGAALPAAEELPADLAELARRQSITLRDETWHSDVERLVRSLRGETAVPPDRRRRRIVVVGVVVVAALAGGGAWWAVSREGDTGGAGGSDGEASALPACPPFEDGTGWTPIELAEDTSASTDDQLVDVTVKGAQWRPVEDQRWQVELDVRMFTEEPGGSEHGSWVYGPLIVGEIAFEEIWCFTADPEVVIADTQGAATLGYEVTCEPSGAMELLISDGDRITITKDTEPSEC